MVQETTGCDHSKYAAHFGPAGTRSPAILLEPPQHCAAHVARDPRAASARAALGVAAAEAAADWRALGAPQRFAREHLRERGVRAVRCDAVERVHQGGGAVRALIAGVDDLRPQRALAPAAER